ncbi:hypothetical protein I9018_19945 [Pseudomonas sp. MPFS]|uniref:hypothetical protein n=1 Tax=Pseudomonas sp. MPFS TaxID=2795724 RepID=UPI001F1484AA|nr:hypothetical protein [Pseudomonas sp. MPFS]UMZ09781.1 hypothetical protein I9018_19945 [Pseudomonas sp. MPFS]
MMREARPHPRFPFIEVGIFVELLAVSFGLDCSPSENSSWCYTIDGDGDYPIVLDEEGAIRSAEETLFAA